LAEIEVWRGGVAAWEADEMGHLNVGFYVAKAMEALAGLAAELGMPRAFAPAAEATLVVR
jgi:acyl-CoA thioester hydrolase